MNLRDRPTPDLVVLFLVLLIAVVVVGALVGAILLAVFRPAIDLTKIAIRLADVTNTAHRSGRRVLGGKVGDPRRQRRPVRSGPWSR